MKRRDFIQGLLSLPFVGYVASKTKLYLFGESTTEIYGDGVELFSTSHSVRDSTFYPAGSLSEESLEEVMMEVIKHKDRYTVRLG